MQRHGMDHLCPIIPSRSSLRISGGVHGLRSRVAYARVDQGRPARYAGSPDLPYMPLKMAPVDIAGFFDLMIVLPAASASA